MKIMKMYLAILIINKTSYGKYKLFINNKLS